MKSHEYDLRWPDVLSVTLLPVLALVLLAFVLHLGARWRLLPPPEPQWDIDQTILIHQAKAASARHAADILLIGDSSCLMDCSAKQLEDLLPGHRVINLGTLSYLDLRVHADFIRRYLEANPGRLRTVVVLVHPAMLSGPPKVEYQANFLEAFYNGLDRCDESTLYGRISCLLGLDIFRGRLLSRWLPAPLPHSYGYLYGFSTGLAHYMAENNGSAIDPRPPLNNSAKSITHFHLSEKLEAASAYFRNAVPKEIQLMVAITPIPEHEAQPDYRGAYQAMVTQWGAWMGAADLLTNLPPTLLNPLFASPTHLNASGARHYTRLLARSLKASMLTSANGQEQPRKVEPNPPRSSRD
ncbi:MAG: hypothetical protein ACYDH9_11235 [Limisphaerales bacterium]